jgi:UDP-N-acetylglucosamine 2-epimerase (non-hydrolysing)
VSKRKVMLVFGVRPEAIKMAPLVLALAQHDAMKPCVVVTAQHRALLDHVLHTFGIMPAHDLDVMQSRQTLEDISVRVLERLAPVMRAERPDIVLVHGDTLTTFLASYVAFLQCIRVGHVEAGLRTWDKHAPYPEEMNRQLTGVLADVHFAPTTWAQANLLREQKNPSSIFVTGNTITDVAGLLAQRTDHAIRAWCANRRVVLVTAHRRESHGDAHRRVFRAIRRLVERIPDVVVVYPVHPSPAVRDVAEEELSGHERIRLIDPLGLVEMYDMYRLAYLILTDSGGVQEEAPSFGVPVLVLRDTTERPEGVAAGTLRLVGTDEERVFSEAWTLLTDARAYRAMASVANPFGDGRASARIVEALEYTFGMRMQRPEPFVPGRKECGV